MLKWVGACIAAAACIALGFGLAASVNARVRALGDAIRALRLLSRRVTLLCEPMRDALDALQDESALFRRVLGYLDEMPGIAWELALKQTRELNAQDAAIIARIAADSGSGGRTEQEAIYAAGIAHLEEREYAAREKASGDARLCRTLGLLAAATILILSI